MATATYSYNAAERILPRTLRRPPSRMERMWTAVVLLYMSGAIVPLLTNQTADTDVTAIKPLSLAIKSAVYLFVFFYISRNRRQMLKAAWQTRWIMAPMLLSLISVLWSQYPSLTLRSSLVLSATAAAGLYFGVRYSPVEQLQMLSCTLLTTIALSYVFALLFPAYGLEQQGYMGAWRGAFIQKNNMAQIMVLACFVLYFARPWIGRWICWTGITASLTLVYLSRSATAILVIIILVAIMPLYRLARGPFTLLIASGFFSAVFVTLCSVFAGSSVRDALQIADRSPDLTGRTELWSAVLLSWAKRPILGYGFNAFWVGMQGESENVWRAVGWKPGYSHNGFLDILIELGIVGLIVFLAGYFALWRHALQQLRSGGDLISRWFCIYLLFMLVYNLTEGSIMEQNSLLWVLYISNSVRLIVPLQGINTAAARLPHEQ